MRPETLTLLSVDDVVRGGACVDGVRSFREKFFPGATVVDVDAALTVAPDEESAAHIRRAAGLAGYGNGYGNGYGYGYGYGNGNGYGYGYGNGNGNGNGNG